MENNKQGFTLIELLIVVLIIGILAAIAVPQYQKAVLKSRFSSLMPTTKSIRDGQEMYYMTNGRYADAVTKLDVTTANTEDMILTLSDDSDYAYTMATRPNINNNLIMYQKHSANFPGEIHCEALEDNSQAEWLCGTALHGTPLTSGSVTEGYNTYVLEGSAMGLFGGADDDTLTCDKAESMGLTCSITINEQGQTVKQVCINSFCRTKTYEEDGSYTSVTCQTNSKGVCTSNAWKSATYDANGNKLTERTCSSVDNNGNCTVYSNSNAYNYTYDANGNMLTKRTCSSMDSDGNCTAYSNTGYNYTYDTNGNQLTKRLCNSVDGSGNCTAYAVGVGSYDYTYDANGNKLTQRYCGSRVDSNGNCTMYSDSNAYDYTYDANGNMLTKRYCSSMDSDGNCTAYSNNYAFDYTYDANGNKLTERYCDSVDSSGKCTAYSTSNAYDYTYDANGNMLTQRTCNSMDNNGNCTAYIYAYDYTYDDNGNQLTQRYCNSMDSSGKCTAYSNSYAYDYTYDDNGNKLTQRYCSRVDSSGKCTKYKGTSYDYIYDENGKQIAYQVCSGSNLNTSTGECLAYNSAIASAI